MLVPGDVTGQMPQCLKRSGYRDHIMWDVLFPGMSLRFSNMRRGQLPHPIKQPGNEAQQASDEQLVRITGLERRPRMAALSGSDSPSWVSLLCWMPIAEQEHETFCAQW